MKGNDGNYWIIKKLNNHNRWIKYRNSNEKEKKYKILDNRDDTFLVRSTNKIINIYAGTRCLYDKKIMNEYYIEYNNLIFTINKFLKIYPGIDNSNKLYNDINNGPKRNGNSIIVKLKSNEYLYIGDRIYLFKIQNNDEIIKYYSPIGNNMVPYPYILGKKYTYLMIDEVYIDNNLLVNDNPYTQYYSTFPSMKKKQNKETKEELAKFKKIKTKLLHDTLRFSKIVKCKN
jgi:hypothetical protein